MTQVRSVSEPTRSAPPTLKLALLPLTVASLAAVGAAVSVSPMWTLLAASIVAFGLVFRGSIDSVVIGLVFLLALGDFLPPAIGPALVVLVLVLLAAELAFHPKPRLRFTSPTWPVLVFAGAVALQLARGTPADRTLVLSQLTAIGAAGAVALLGAIRGPQAMATRIVIATSLAVLVGALLSRLRVEYVVSADSFSRLSGNFADPNVFGIVAAICVAFLIFKPGLPTVVVGCLGLPLVLCVLLSGSLSAILALCVMGVLVLMGEGQVKRPKTRSKAASAVIVLAAMLAVFSFTQSQYGAERLNALTAERAKDGDGSFASGRAATWSAAIEVIHGAPVLGAGPHSSMVAIAARDRHASGRPIRAAHNTLLGLAASYGLLAGLAIAGFLIATLLRVWASYGRRCLIVAAPLAIGLGTLDVERNKAVVLLVAALWLMPADSMSKAP